MRVFQAVVWGTTCESGSIVGGGATSFQFRLQAHQILHLTYPTPLVFSPLEGRVCVGAQVTTVLTFGVDFVFNGFVP